MCIVCQPDMVLSNEDLQTELSEPRKEVGKPIPQDGVAISEPKKTDDLKFNCSGSLEFWEIEKFLLDTYKDFAIFFCLTLLLPSYLT
jgi:hypothetical protein